MPEYRFGKKHDQSGPDQPESRQIPVQDGQVTFQISHQPGANMSESVKPANQKKLAALSAGPKPGQSSVRRDLTNRIWHILEFVAVTAVIFTVLFFIINFDSYSRLFTSKLDQIRGQINQNPYTQQEIEALKTASPEGQKPLPIVNTTQATKRQVPELNLSIAPPDDRILIPRIGQNVPIIRVPTDELLKRNWSALEKQIQEALRYGVVHFPGTAMPGDKGNVVITGHSSYFPWDPGRFKDVFALLHQVDVGDNVIVYHDQKKYEYRVYDKKVIKPSQVDILTQEGEDRLTLITCTPVGTDLNRLVLLARPI
jgi:LPXTG-site transpeptidase (sortase) family protein